MGKTALHVDKLRNAYIFRSQILMGKHYLGGPTHILGDNIKMDLTEVGF
jgi:hypothetical protein